MKKQKVIIIGAGLAGSLLSIYLAKRGLAVEVYEARSDMRTEEISAGRSINLALSDRGIAALREIAAVIQIRADVRIRAHVRDLNADALTAGNALSPPVKTYVGDALPGAFDRASDPLHFRRVGSGIFPADGNVSDAVARRPPLPARFGVRVLRNPLLRTADRAEH